MAALGTVTLLDELFTSAGAEVTGAGVTRALTESTRGGSVISTEVLAMVADSGMRSCSLGMSEGLAMVADFGMGGRSLGLTEGLDMTVLYG